MIRFVIAFVVLVTLIPAVTIAASSRDQRDAGRRDAAKFERDRRAILAMAGKYRVSFEFEETVAFAAGYTLQEPYHSEATELVEVIEDSGEFIALQHLLVVQHGDHEPRVIKHWRQDWTYQDTDVLGFRGHRTWEHVTLTPEQAAGTWTQAVYQVDDAPRYESYGTWTHLGENASWESHETWRPLPRREYTHRDDYQVLVARNRHCITPAGWVHEQNNAKLVLDDTGQPLKVLAHETGLNTYTRDDSLDMTAAHAYWVATRAYWHDVRAAWTDALRTPRRLTLLSDVEGERLRPQLYELAEETEATGRYDSDAMADKVRSIIGSFLTNADVRASAR